MGFKNTEVVFVFKLAGFSRYSDLYVTLKFEALFEERLCTRCNVRRNITICREDVNNSEFYKSYDYCLPSLGEETLMPIFLFDKKFFYFFGDISSF